MAHIITAWRADGKGQSEIKHMRSDDKGYSHEGRDLWIETMKGDAECVLITRSRTDKQSPREDILWTRPGYVDPAWGVGNTNLRLFFVTAGDYSTEYAAVVAAESAEEAIALTPAAEFRGERAVAIETPVEKGVIVSDFE